MKFSGIPLEWKICFLIDAILACVKDTAQLLLSRLIKPSPLPSVGEYVAGFHHLRLL